MGTTRENTTNHSNCSIQVVYPTLPHRSCLVDTSLDEFLVAILIILLVIYTAYRILHVWAKALNFTEVSDSDHVFHTIYINSDAIFFRPFFQVQMPGTFLLTGSRTREGGGKRQKQGVQV